MHKLGELCIQPSFNMALLCRNEHTALTRMPCAGTELLPIDAQVHTPSTQPLFHNRQIHMMLHDVQK